MQHFFLYISLPLFCMTTTWNFQKLLSYKFYGGNVVRVPVHLFSLPLIFSLHWWPLAFLILSPPLQNFRVVLPTNKCLLCFLSLALNPCRPFSRWASLACRPHSLFLRWVDCHIILSRCSAARASRARAPIWILNFPHHNKWIIHSIKPRSQWIQ